MKPRIGVTTSLGSSEKPTSPTVPVEYVDAVAAAGGVPVVLPPVDSARLVAEQLLAVHGIVLIGGPDYGPKAYGEKLDPATNLIDRRRERYDFALVRAADRLAVPMLGICGGHQLIAIARGGSIIQDLGTSGLYPKLMCHASKRVRHKVRVESGSLAAKVLGCKELKVNSFHHQAVMKPGRNMRVTSRCVDGVCEAVEDARAGREGRFVLGLQWHPERMFTRSARQLKPFQALVAAARKESRG